MNCGNAARHTTMNAMLPSVDDSIEGGAPAF
jgi:hypothetical protein